MTMRSHQARLVELAQGFNHLMIRHGVISDVECVVHKLIDIDSFRLGRSIDKRYMML